jgi:hypothetical protein
MNLDIKTQHVCIKICEKKKDPEDRKLYESWDVENRRQLWLDYKLGLDGLYVGRPSNNGGWYKALEVKKGSIFANPYSTKEYSLEDSLCLYKEYLNVRLSEDCNLEKIINIVPKGKSMKYLELHIFGEEFRERLIKLKGKRLGCFCYENNPCHAKILALKVEELCTFDP